MKTRSIAACAVAVLAVVAIVLTVVGYYGTQRRGPAPSTTASATSAPIPVSAGSVQAYYDQAIEWGACADGTFDTFQGVNSSDASEYQCAFLKAPLDWGSPDGDQITLALAIHRSGAKDAPALFINPGGPGGAVVSSLPYYATQGIGEAVVNAYDIVALDPRGVGDSTPVFCTTDAERDERNAGEDKDVDTGDESPQSAVAAAHEDSLKVAAGCREHSGSLYEHIDTVSAARDFDMVRAVLGQEKLNLLGYSYGTFLGATYAGLFPENVGRFVLDGALDPTLSVNEVLALQMRGLDASLQHWISDCATQATCPMGRNLQEGIETVRSFLDSLEDNPMRTNDPNRPLTENLAVTALTGAMYNTQWWPQLTQAFGMAWQKNDGSGLLAIADTLNSRNPDGTYQDNSFDAINAINNLDYSPEGTIEQWAAQVETLKNELPILGKYVGYPSAGLEAWPTKHARRSRITAQGAAPIVVIGTTHDPATPYSMAQGLSGQLASGVLVTVEGWNHTAYRRGANQCVTRAVEDYFVNGTVPTDGLMCQ